MIKEKKSDQKLNNLRHSCAHLMAAAILELWPKAKLTLGPAIENGFYYDIDFGGTKINEDNLLKIEAGMREIVKNWTGFGKQTISVEEAQKQFQDNPYKLELIGELANQEKAITVYKSGDFVDLCAGEHITDPQKALKHYKLLSVAGAYWRGDEKNPMLTRIYGTCWPAKKELDDYLVQLEEAKARDHRKIGKELELFAFAEDIGPGLPLWLPNGTIIKEELEKWAIETERKQGYFRVRTPHIGKKNLYETSGHLPYYDDDMFPPLIDEEGEIYYLKPMNCPHHHMIYANKKRSYKELPLRLAEYGEVYRWEKSGELHGMLRVRFISQNDAHIYCTLDQAKEEFKKVIELHQYYYRILGLKNYYIELALRDPENKKKYHGDEKMWQKAENLSRQAIKESRVSYVEKEGTAAFYGPKVDFNIKSVTGKEFGASTNQLDLYMADRFSLKYTDQDGSEQSPVIIHRAPLGSSERLVGFLIEHFVGAFPVWLSPIQAIVIPVSEKQKTYAQAAAKEIKNEIPNARIEVDDSSETLPKKIRKAQLQKIPYMLIAGEREKRSKSVSLRLRSEENLGEISMGKIIERIKETIDNKSLKL